MIRIASAKSIGDLADQWLSSKSLSAVTLRAYRVETNRFIRWMASNEGSRNNSLCLDLINSFFFTIGSEQAEIYSLAGISKPLHTSSMLQAKRIINLWMRWCAANQLVPAELALLNSWKPPKRTRVRPPDLSSVNLKQLLYPPAKASKSKSSVRNSLIVSLAFWLGSKPSEISALKSKEIKVSKSGIEVRLPKGKTKSVWVPGPPPLLDAWKAYLRVRGKSKFAIESLSKPDKCISASSIGRIIRMSTSQKNTPTKPNEKVNSRQLKGLFVNHASAIGWQFNELYYYLRHEKSAIVEHPTITMSKLRSLSYKTAKSL